ncbi:cytidine deaminase [Actinopolymorpha cephalotaxi]|uniref:Cytidine deaminase n=1 Tax=Actinopolymorpha cephalotaxi TaxID=504797 RepID=A0A1I2KRH7_9ACTN|nr:cytidine deaminase [Actinopolymorpha cephalotaxi]NYH84627.1 cytidine deaminase [Actinopolymorpha cephalotaxi]SFF69632.1 cytidine deaminase [Actinopolymorpha cephalotaxi]
MSGGHEDVGTNVDGDVSGGVSGDQVDWAELRAAAREVRAGAYVPYSHYPVGAAALVDDGRVVAGCNVENASYGMTLCAECGLVSALHASGGGRLVAFTCCDGQGALLMPCGRCRQLLWEHGGPRLLVDTPRGVLPMTEVLPDAFGPDHLTEYQSGTESGTAESESRP